MATATIDLLRGLVPGSSGNVWFEPVSIKFTNDIHPSTLGLVFADTSTKDGASVHFQLPGDFASAASFTVVWTSTATSGDVVWDVDYTCIGGNDTESLDPVAVARALTVTDTAPGAALRRLSVNLAATDADFAASDTVLVNISRDGLGGGPDDTMAAAAILVGFYFTYTTA